MNEPLDKAMSNERVFKANEVRRVLLEIRGGVFYHHNGMAHHKAVYLLNIENAFARLEVAGTARNEHARNHINVRTFYCSNCHTHTERVFKYAPPGGPRTVKFCPGCGARIIE